MLNRLVTVVILIPLAIVLIALAVANRAPAEFTLDPFNPGNPALTVSAPLFVLLFCALVLGLLLGSVATWFRQGRYRRIARRHPDEIARTSASAAPPPRTTPPARLER